MKCLVVLALVAACGASTHQGASKANKPGIIAGLIRDTKTGEVIALAEISVAGRTAKSNKYGMYEFENLKPGTYTLIARFADVPVTINNILVSPNQATYVDVPFTLGEPSPLTIDWGDPREGEIKHFTTKAPRIEGTVGDASTRERVPGAVVTAARGPEYETYQTVTDDHGRYRFDQIDPGTYAISAYYSIGGRAQIEVRRSDVTVTREQAAFVPLWIEIAKQ